MMPKEKGSLDPRLKGIHLSDSHDVFVALGGNEDCLGRFDFQTYFQLPIGQRLLTAAELEALSELDKRPEPESGSPDFVMWYMLCVSQDNGGDPNPWSYNWDPQKKQPVYYDETEIPYEMTHEACQRAGPEELARRAEIKSGLLGALGDILQNPTEDSK